MSKISLFTSGCVSIRKGTRLLWELCQKTLILKRSTLLFSVGIFHFRSLSPQKSSLATGPSHTPFLPSLSNLCCALLFKNSPELHFDHTGAAHYSWNSWLGLFVLPLHPHGEFNYLLLSLRAHLSPSLRSGSREKITKLYTLLFLGTVIRTTSILLMPTILLRLPLDSQKIL